MSSFDDLKDRLHTSDHQLWLWIGLCVALLVTMEAVQEAVEGAWPHQRRLTRMDLSEQRSQPVWALVALLILPAALPGLVATSIYGFINAWNELILAVVLINSPNLQTLPVGLSSLIDENRTEYGMLMAVAVLSLVPSLLFFGWIQRYLTTGLSAGAVKG